MIVCLGDRLVCLVPDFVDGRFRSVGDPVDRAGVAVILQVGTALQTAGDTAEPAAGLQRRPGVADKPAERRALQCCRGHQTVYRHQTLQLLIADKTEGSFAY